ncbi:MAG: hypothetical protein, partial [Olavius algarvensis Gamma 1 endosymbiont]
VARAQGERGTGMSRFASRARRHSEPSFRLGWSESTIARAGQLDRWSVAGDGIPGSDPAPSTHLGGAVRRCV